MLLHCLLTTRDLGIITKKEDCQIQNTQANLKSPLLLHEQHQRMHWCRYRESYILDGSFKNHAYFKNVWKGNVSSWRWWLLWWWCDDDFGYLSFLSVCYVCLPKNSVSIKFDSNVIARVTVHSCDQKSQQSFITRACHTSLKINWSRVCEFFLEKKSWSKWQFVPYE